MATTLEELEKRVSLLEQMVAEMRQEQLQADQPPIWQIEGREPTRAEVIAWLKARGAPIGEPTPEMKARAQRWRDLPEEDKRALRAKLDSLKLDPPLSELILQNRR